MEALTQRDPGAAAELVQTAGALVAVLPGSLDAVGRVAATVPPTARPMAHGHEYAFDVLTSVESLLRTAPPTILDEVSSIYRAATVSSSGTV
jgi:hypothetical protein